MDTDATSEHDADAIAAIRQRRAVGQVVAFASVLMLGAAALLRFSVGSTGALLPAPWWTVVAVAALYGFTELWSFHVEYRREALTITLSEIPLVLSLAFLGPIPAILARVIGSLVVVGAKTRPKPYKVWFNVGSFAFEVSLAFAVVRYAVDADSFDGVAFLFAAAFGAAGVAVIGSIGVSVAISLFESGLRDRVVHTLRTTGLVGPFSATLAVVTVAPGLIGPAALSLSIVPAAGLWMILRHLGRLEQKHRDLEAMHGVAGLVGQSLESDVVATTALTEALRLLRATSGMVVVYGDLGEVVASEHRGSTLPPAPTDRCDPRWSHVNDATGAGYVGDLFADGVGPIAHRDMIAAPIRDDRGVVGLLVLADRHGVANRFVDADLARVTTLAAHVATSLRKTLLHASMEYAAKHDALTGHLTRDAFDEAVTDALVNRRADEVAAMLMLDLDQFKEINDTLGHHVGDELLVEFARRISGLLDPDDVFARFGGDEFAVFVTRPDPIAVHCLGDRILQQSYTALELERTDVVVAVSVGIAQVASDEHDTTAVLRRADVAMYAAKRQRSGLEVYSAEIDRRTPERLALLGDLRSALDDDSIVVHFQPKIDLATSTIVGFEALARWNHPTRGWVAPDEFIPVAEETGLIKQVTDRVLNVSLAAARRWRDSGLDVGVAVNLSTLDLLDELLAERVAHRLEQHGLLPEHLTLEITESSLMADTPRTMSTITRLDRLGVALSLDDFGTGYSSLSYLRRLPVTEIKIDRSFVSDILNESQDEMIVRSTIDLGHNLGLRVVAEGIEDDDAIRRLTVLGCDIGQGYGIARPLDAQRLTDWLATTTYGFARIDEAPRRPGPVPVTPEHRGPHAGLDPTAAITRL